MPARLTREVLLGLTVLLGWAAGFGDTAPVVAQEPSAAEDSPVTIYRVSESQPANDQTERGDRLIFLCSKTILAYPAPPSTPDKRLLLEIRVSHWIPTCNGPNLCIDPNRSANSYFVKFEVFGDKPITARLNAIGPRLDSRGPVFVPYLSSEFVRALPGAKTISVTASTSYGAGGLDSVSFDATGLGDALKKSIHSPSCQN
jgi:hypothetical protein